ncbi:MAG: cbb3-type cytochrome oxidase assembly protein CcoS [Devosia sp.]
MEVLIYLVPIALILSVGGLFAFFWALGNGQYEDMKGAAERILYQDDEGSDR